VLSHSVFFAPEVKSFKAGAPSGWGMMVWKRKILKDCSIVQKVMKVDPLCEGHPKKLEMKISSLWVVS
jgi:hypothetical protein